MGKLMPGFNIIGSTGNLSFYTRRDMDGIIVRTKGGASKRKIKRHPAFANTRKINAEFGARSTLTRYIMQAIETLRPLADYNIAGPLNKLIKPAQDLDTENEIGQRSILLSKIPALLENFSLNRRTTLDSIIRQSFSIELDRKKAFANIDVPKLIPGINFFVPPNLHHPVFSLVMQGELVPDFAYEGKSYKEADRKFFSFNLFHESEWFPVVKGCDAFTLSSKIDLKKNTPSDAGIFVLGIGLKFGTIGANGDIEQVKHAGAAKIIAVG